MQRGSGRIARHVLLVACCAALVSALGITAALDSPSVSGSWPEKGPYLLYPGDPSQMTILWQLNSSATCTVSWWEGSASPQSRTVTSSSSGPKYEYSMTLTGLAPETTYNYEVSYGTGTAASTFRTAPSSTATEVKFLGWADTQQTKSSSKRKSCYWSTTDRTLRHVIADPDWQTMIVHAGDWAHGSDPEGYWTPFFGADPARELLALMPIQGCAGNHDVIAFKKSEYWNPAVYTKLLARPYIKYWPYPYVADHYWSFDYGPIHFVVLDQFSEEERTKPLTVQTSQYTWLKRDLASNRKPWTIVIQHVPLKDRSEYGVSQFLPWLYADRMRTLFEQYNVDLILAGHYHQHAYESSPIPQLTMGAAGEGEGLFYTFDVKATRMTIKAYSKSGRLVDTINVTRR